jgi:RNA polymerase sigma-70 factor (ECF subfamily)
MPVPETRASLILRLPTVADAEAWREFVSIYEPFVYRFARRGGLQDADARELVQNVMLAVARAVGRWRVDGNRGKFRTWLFRIARNQLIDLSKGLRRHAMARGGTSMFAMLDQQPVEDWPSDELLLSHRRQLFRWAADRIQTTVKPATWQAFYMTAIENKPAEDVATELGMSVGAVYVARSRVLAKLQEEVKKWEDDGALS